MRFKLSLTALMLATAVFAGCIGDEGAPAPETPGLPDLATVLDVTHDEENGHQVAANHMLSSPNMDLVAFHSLAGDGVAFVDGNAEVTYHDGYAYVATLGDTSGFVIVDVSDPAAPEVVGRYSDPNVYSPDVKVSWDGDWAFLSAHPGTTLGSHLPVDPLPMSLPDPLAYTEENHATGVTLVDISDKADPVFVDFFPVEPDGTHNTEYAKIDGRELVFSVDRYKVQVLEITATPAGAKLVPISTIVADDDWRDRLPGAATSTSTNPGSYLPASSHDVVYQQHPLTNDHLVYIAFGGAGFYIYNVNDPTNPAMLGKWKGLPEGSSYYHYARPVDILIDDYHLTVVAPEVFNSDSTTGTIAILDTSDPRNPEEIATWTLPGDDLFIEANYRFSPHNFAIQDGKVYLASYHAGVWVLDLACDDCMFEPKVDGFYLPHAESDRRNEPGENCAFWCERPFIWGVVVDEQGLLYASDVESGLYVIDHTPIAPGEEEADA